MTLERLVTARELAELLGTRLNSVYELAATGELPSLKVPGVGRRFLESEVSAWLEGCRSRPANRPLNMREPDLCRAQDSRDDKNVNGNVTATG